jgi:hypothetical protein
VIIGWKSGQSCCLEYEVSFDVAYALAQSGGTFLASETLAIPAKNVSNPHEARGQRLTRLCSVFSRQNNTVSSPHIGNGNFDRCR